MYIGEIVVQLSPNSNLKELLVIKYILILKNNYL